MYIATYANLRAICQNANLNAPNINIFSIFSEQLVFYNYRMGKLDLAIRTTALGLIGAITYLTLKDGTFTVFSWHPIMMSVGVCDAPI